MRVALLSRVSPRCVRRCRSTSNTWPESWRNWSTCRCTASAPPPGRAAGVPRGDRPPDLGRPGGRRPPPGGPAHHRHRPVDRRRGRGADLAHSHTWYANLAGHLAKLLYGIPHVVSVHSLEPLRPWKVEQLAGGYHVSRWCEQTSIEAADKVIAVSAGMAADILSVYPAVDSARIQVIHNGIDTEQYKPDRGTDVLEAYGVDPDRPSVIFVGRITRQKGVPHLLDALALDPAAQLILCAGAPDTPSWAAR